MSIEQFKHKENTASIVAALDRDGAVVVRDVIDASTTRCIVEELRESFAALPQAQAKLDPDVIFAQSPSAVAQIAHPCVQEVVAAILLRHCSSVQLGAADAVEMRAGADAQNLALDAGVYNMRIPGVELQVSAIWALADLTADNGAPTLIPGSHRGDKMRMPDSQDMLTVPMTRGSLLLCMGWTLRGWSANGSGQSSAALVNRYSLGWLRPEVNFILSLPAAVAESCPVDVRRLLGFESYENGRLGRYPGESG